MVDGLESVMGPKTAATIMAIAAGLMSFFSSGLGVVFPTLIPTASGLAASIGGVTALELVSVIVIGGTVSGFTPISTTGALIMAGVAQQENADEKFPAEPPVCGAVCGVLYRACSSGCICFYWNL